MNKCFQGDCRTIMRQLTDDGVKVQTIVTSPPYYGLRDYKLPPSDWPEITFVPVVGLPPMTIPAWTGCLGLEPDGWMFVAHIVDVFRAARGLLEDDGTMWVNFGDSYAANHGSGSVSPADKQSTNGGSLVDTIRNPKKSGLKQKDLMGIPWRVALALQADNWYLRQDIIWAKPNPMPESVTDRCTKAHEYIFLLSKSPRYYFDADAIKEDCVQKEMANGFRGGAYCNNETFDNAEGGKRKVVGNYKTPDGWDTSKGNGGHGSFHKDGREKGHRLPGNVNPPKGQKAYEDGDEFHRTKAGLLAYTEKKRKEFDKSQAGGGSNIDGHTGNLKPDGTPFDYVFSGKRNKRSVWIVASQPFKEAHFATFPPKLVETCILAGSRPGDIVFDPFMGSGTVGQVAQQLGRKWLGAELNQEYIAMQVKRTIQQGLMLA